MKRAQPYDRDVALDAALRVFWQKGYHATSLKDLESALAMKPGSIYAAFSSKESLYLSALERYFDRNRDAMQAEFSQAASPLQALADHLRSLGKPLGPTETGRACMLVKTMLATTAQDATISDRSRAYLDAMTEDITAAFDKARAAGEIAPDADTARLARRFQADITSLRIEAQRDGDPQALAELAEDMARSVEDLRI